MHGDITCIQRNMQAAYPKEQNETNINRPSQNKMFIPDSLAPHLEKPPGVEELLASPETKRNHKGQWLIKIESCKDFNGRKFCPQATREDRIKHPMGLCTVLLAPCPPQKKTQELYGGSSLFLITCGKAVQSKQGWGWQMQIKESRKIL